MASENADINMLSEAVKSTQKLINQVEFNKVELDNYQHTVEILQKDIEELETSDHSLLSKIEELQREVKHYEEEEADKTVSVQSLKDKIKDQTEVVETLNCKISAMHSAVEDNEKTQKKQELRILDLSKEKSTVVEELSASKSIVEKDKKIIGDLYNEIDRLKYAGNNEVMKLRCEHTRLEEKLVSKSEACERWSNEVNHLREKISNKVRQLDEWRMKYDDVSRAKVQMGVHHQNPITLDLQYIQDENNGLKVKVVHYQKSILDLKESFAAKEEEYRQRIFLFQVEKQDMLKDYEVLREKLVRIQSCLDEEKLLRQQQTQHLQLQMNQSSFTDVCLLQKQRSAAIDRRISNGRAELEQTLAKLAESATNREALMRDLKRGLKNPNEKIRYQNYNMYHKKLYSNSINQNEKDAIVKRLGKTQEDMKRLEAENAELLAENSICKNENTKLASRVRCYQEALGTLEEAMSGKKTLEKENKRLAEIIQDHEVKLRKANQQLEDFDQNKRKTIKLECRLENRDKERASLDKMISNLQKELEFHQQSSRMLSGGCCFELKIKKEQLESNVKQLEQKSELLETQISILQGSLDIKNEAQNTQYVELQKLLERAQQENEDLRLRADNNHEEHRKRSTLDQPSVNVHVHLDPQTLQLKRNESQTLLRDSNGVTRESDVVGTKSKATQESDTSKLKHDIQKLTKHKNQLTKQLEAAHKEMKELQNTQLKRLPDKALKEKLEVARKEIQALKNAQGKGDNQVTSLPKKRLTKQLEIARKELKELQEAQSKDDNQVQSLQQKLDACLAEKKELLHVKEEIELEIEKFELKKEKMVEKMMKMRCLFDEKQTEWEEKEDEWKRCGEKQISELNALREQLHAFSKTADIQTLRNKIQDLSNKKEKNEMLITRLKEDKSELQMAVDKLERELLSTKQKLEFQETQRAQVRRNGESLVETSEAINNTPALVEKSKLTYPSWLESAVNNAQDMQQVTDVQQQRKQISTPIWLTSNEPQQEKETTSVEQPSTQTRRRPLGTADGFGEEFLTASLKRTNNAPQQQQQTQQQNALSSQQERRSLETSDGFGDIYITALKPLKQLNKTPQEQNNTQNTPSSPSKNAPKHPTIPTYNTNNAPNRPQQLHSKTSSEQTSEQQKQASKVRRGVSVQNIKANPGFLDDFAGYTPTGMVLQPQKPKLKKRNEFAGEEFDFLRLDSSVKLESKAPPPPPVKVGPRDRSHLM